MNGSLNSRGFSTLEALIAVAVIAVGSVGVFGMVATSQEALNRAAERGDMVYQAQEIVDELASDAEDIVLYSQDLTQCAVPSNMKAKLAPGQIKKYLKWCERIKGEAGNASSTTLRNIKVQPRSVNVENALSKFFVVTVELTDTHGKSVVTTRRIINADQG